MENTKIIGKEQVFSYFPSLPLLFCCIFFCPRKKLNKNKIVRSLEDVAKNYSVTFTVAICQNEDCKHTVRYGR
jgi:hypothetical protein